MTRLVLTLLSLLFAVGCYSAPNGARPLTPGELEVVQDRIDAWRQAGLDDVGQQCVEQLDHWRVLQPETHEAMLEATGYCGPPPERGGCAAMVQSGECQWGCAAAAQLQYGEGFFLAQSFWPLTVVWHETDPARALRHEAVHWLQGCTGRGHVIQRPHADPEVWCHDGCPGRWRR